MHLVVAGHVDHGKSTVIGRLLADTGSVPASKIAAVRAQCDRNAKPFEHAFLLDALKDERAQGITIDTARIFFDTPKRRYVILDAPGHIEFLKNMITGAAHAEAALLVVDAQEGVQENSRRHAHMISLLGITSVAVLVNKMDLVAYDENAFRDVSNDYQAFLTEVGIQPLAIIPVSGAGGANVAARGTEMPWYEGPTVLDALDRLKEQPERSGQWMRMPVQDVYKFTAAGDDRRIVAGTVESGQFEVGDEIAFYPSGKRSVVDSIEGFGRDAIASASATQATGFTLREQIYVARGELATRSDQPPPDVSSRVRASIFWLGRAPLCVDDEVLLKLGTARVRARVEQVERVMDGATLATNAEPDQVKRHEVAECILKARRPLAFDVADEASRTARFVVVQDYDIRGGGIIRASLPDAQARVREQVLARNEQWERSRIGARDRAASYGQKPLLLLITGPVGGARKEVAKALEQRLFREGRLVYYLGFGSVLHGLDADLEESIGDVNIAELMRRLGEIAHIMLDAGLILIVTVRSLAPEDLAVLRTTVDPTFIQVVWVGAGSAPAVPHDLDVGDAMEEDAVEAIHTLLIERKSIFGSS